MITRLLARGCLLSLIVAAVAAAQVDRGRVLKTPVGDVAGTQRASCVLTLDDAGRGARQAFDPQTLNALLTSTAVIDPAARQALKLGPTEWPKVVQIELMPAGNSAVRVNVVILPDAKLQDGAAQAFLNGITAAAKAAVAQVGGTQRKSAVERIARLEAELDAAQKKYAAANSALAAVRPSGDDDGDGRFIARNAAAERANLELSLVGQKARLKVLDEELPKMRPSTPPAAPASQPLSKRPAADSREDGPGLFERFEAERLTLRLDLLTARLAVDVATTRPAAIDVNRLQAERNEAREGLQSAQNRLEQTRREPGAEGGLRLLILDGQTSGD